jgi:hypothetical protein
MTRKQIVLIAAFAVLCSWNLVVAGEMKPGAIVRGKVYMGPSPYVWYKSPDGTTIPAEIKWPAAILKSFYIPPSVEDVWYASDDGQFMVYYEAQICYPAMETIKAMAALMRSQGWDHMTDYPLCQGTPLPPEIPDNDRSWGGRYPWDSYWRDASGDVVWYHYSYYVDVDIPANSPLWAYQDAVQRSCSLTVSIAYYTPDAFERMLKAAKEEIKRLEKREKEKTKKLEKGADISK